MFFIRYELNIMLNAKQHHISNNQMSKKIYSTLLLLFTLFVVQAQVTFQPRKLSNDDKGIVYQKEVTGDLRLQTDGWALGMTFGKLKAYNVTQFIYGGVGELRHPREVWTNDFRNGRRYVFGKQNNFYTLRGGWGQKRYFSEKSKRKGAAIGMTYQIGPSLGFIKPYHLEIFVLESRTERTRSIRFSEDTVDDFLDKEKIFGSSGVLTGWGNMKIAPGAQFMLAAHFDWGAYDEVVKAIEAGLMVDLYFQNVPIMIELERFGNLKNRPVFFNFFINIQFGKRS